MARGKKKEKRPKGAKKGESKGLKRARRQWKALEDEIDQEFQSLVKDGFDIGELETLRWDYRYDKLDRFKLTQEQVVFFVAEAEAVQAGLPPPTAPGGVAEPGAQVAPFLPGAPSGEYQRKSEVDLALIEKHLEHRANPAARADLESAYREAFGEDLVVPANLDLVDLSYRTSEISEAHRVAKITKEEILGIPAEARPEEGKKVEAEAPKVEAAPAVKRESKAAAVAMAWKKGVPKGPTRDERWSAWNPFKFWLIPKRLAGTSVGRYYVILLANFVIFIGQFVLLLIPFLFRLIVWGSRYLWLRFLKRGVTARMQVLKEKAAIPPAGAGEPTKKTEGAKSS